MPFVQQQIKESKNSPRTQLDKALKCDDVLHRLPHIELDMMQQELCDLKNKVLVFSLFNNNCFYFYLLFDI